MKKSVKLISCLLCAAMLVTLSSCNSEKKKDDTTTTTAKKTVTTSSDRTKVESDYEIKKVDDLVVAVGTSEQDVIAKLPTELEVLMKGSSSAASEKLFTETFDSADTFAQSWTVVGNANNDVMAIENGSMAVKKACNYFRAYLNDLEWMNNESEEFANYAIKTVIKGTAESPSNNFGIIFRASDISETGPDGYYGMYVGIGDSDGKLCVGYAMNNWNLVEYVDFDYVPNQDYTFLSSLIPLRNSWFFSTVKTCTRASANLITEPSVCVPTNSSSKHPNLKYALSELPITSSLREAMSITKSIP